MSKKKTLELHIFGLVQGVGFRPFVVQLAKKCNVAGWVKNDGGIVVIEASGSPGELERFVSLLREDSPPGADITQIRVQELPFREYADFNIGASGSQETETPVVPPDLPLCGQCKKELYDKEDRRYQNPFISCVSCGPRYSIISRLPYDRCRTTMSEFEMCAECAGEYRSGGRRDYAQTISCNGCGPFLIFKNNNGEFRAVEALQKSADILNAGGVLAIKGIGGYHFACSPFSAKAVKRLRLLKQRDKKPFAVMFKSMDAIREYCEVSDREEKLLLSSPRPIVLLPFDGKGLAPEVCGESRYLGAFLPYAPLQELLMDACGPLVMTSANVTDQPVLTQDEDVLSIQSEYLDGVLYNTRRIVTPLDDSVARVAWGREQVIRRSRGMTPMPVLMPVSAPKPLFAAGADLKAAFCLTAGNRAYLSQYLGDLDNMEAAGLYRKTYVHMAALLSIQPEFAACDLHPDYASTRFARESGLPVITVQHHHAHIASVMAEHGIAQKTIGVAFDGTGFGQDGAVWGGEFLVCEGGGFMRAGHLGYVPICGGDNASKDALLCADSYLIAAGCGNRLGDERFGVVQAAIKNRLGVQETSSMGRLFDAASALLGIRMYNSFEGECAIALENLAVRALADGREPYPLAFELPYADGMLAADQAKLAGDVSDAVENGADKGTVALGFHRAIARMVLEICSQIREKEQTGLVALSGGVFANRLLLEDCAQRLTQNGFRVYVNQAVPTNDGGIALGQAFVAAQKWNERNSN